MEDYITLENENNEEVKYEILNTFEDEDNHIVYLTLTDNVEDKDGNIEVIYAKYDDTLEEPPIDFDLTDEEVKMIDEATEESDEDYIVYTDEEGNEKNYYILKTVVDEENNCTYIIFDDEEEPGLDVGYCKYRNDDPEEELDFELTEEEIKMLQNSLLEDLAQDDLEITYEDGTTKNYKIVFDFESNEPNKHYIVYTDNVENENGNYDFLVSSYDPNDEEMNINEITDEELKMVEEMIQEEI